MTHLAQEQIERLLHNEADAHAREHIALCEECRVRMLDAQRQEAEIMGLLTSIDSRPPRLTAAAVMQRARATRRANLSWAAGIVLALAAAGAAAAMPGSPIRAWLTRDTRQAVQPPPATAANAATGIAVDPGERLTIEFRRPQQRGVARIKVIDEGDVVVRSLHGSATFTSGAARLLVDNSATGDFDVQIPRSARYVEIVLGNRRVFVQDASGITASAPADRNGVYILELKPAAE